MSPRNLVLTGSLAQLPYDQVDKQLQRLVRRLSNGIGFQLFAAEGVLEEMCEELVVCINKALLDPDVGWPGWVTPADRSKASQIVSELNSKSKFTAADRLIFVYVYSTVFVSRIYARL